MTEINSAVMVISNTSAVKVWQDYVVNTFKGNDGEDDNSLLKELFFVQLIFPIGCNYDEVDSHWNLQTHKQYVDKMLSTKINKSLGGSYGFRIRCSYGIDQFEAVVEKLVSKPNSKSAVCNLLHPAGSSIETSAGMTRVACLAFVQLLIRDNLLTMVATFRSQNAVNSHGNFIGLHKLHKGFVEALNSRNVQVSLGELRVHVNAAHVYERDFDLAESLISNDV